jgi:hypothetical protein
MANFDNNKLNTLKLKELNARIKLCDNNYNKNLEKCLDYKIKLQREINKDYELCINKNVNRIAHKYLNHDDWNKKIVYMCGYPKNKNLLFFHNTPGI